MKQLPKQLQWRKIKKKITAHYGSITFVNSFTEDEENYFLTYHFLSKSGIFYSCGTKAKEEIEKLFDEMLEELKGFKIVWKKTDTGRELYCGKALLASVRDDSQSYKVHCFLISEFRPDEFTKCQNLDFRSADFETICKKIETEAKKMVEELC